MSSLAIRRPYFAAQELLRNPSYSVLNKFDVFALLNSLFSQIGDCLILNWMQITQYLSKAGERSSSF